MTTKELIKIGKSLGLEHYNECDEYVCFKGVNVGSNVFYSSSKKNLKWNPPSTMKDFAEHIKMMGKDSLRMELHNLLSIVSHY